LTKLFLVDYDIPIESRHSFYYMLKKDIIGFLLREVGDSLEKMRRYKELKRISLRELLAKVEYTKSSQSVVLTSSEELAKLVYARARKMGIAHLYEVRKIA